jgi:DNA-directed RNA polymerase subunit beta'
MRLNKLAKEKPQVYARTVSRLKDLGNQYAYESGFTVGLKDIEVDRKGRDKIFSAASKKAKKVGVVKAYSDAIKKLDSWLVKELGAKNNAFFTMMASGAKGNTNQVRQIAAAPVLVKDINDRAVPYPITKSYGEGLPIADYLSSMPGARKGMIDRALMTAQPGAFSKEYMSSAISERVTMKDCGTSQGLWMSVDDDNVLDRYLAKGVVGIATRNTLITPALLTRMRSKVKQILVRSPSACDAADGVCQLCYGLDEHGQPVEMGRNVGLLAAQALTEPMTQMTMRTFHTGGVAGTNKDPAQGMLGGFERVKELLEMHEHVRGKATLAETGGRVTQMEQSPAGGWNITVGKQEHFVSPGREPTVRVGSNINKGDRLSTGAIKPQELVQLKDVGAVRDYLLKALDTEYKDQGLKVNQKLFETAIRPLINNAQVIEAGRSDYVPGDFASISAIQNFNKGKSKAEQIQFEPMLKGVNTYPLVSEDWLARLNYRKLREAITQGGAQGWKSDIMASPVGAYAYGIFFGKDQEKKAEEDGFEDFCEDGGGSGGGEDPELQGFSGADDEGDETPESRETA